MQKRHFETIAGILRALRGSSFCFDDDDDCYKIAEVFAMVLMTTNDRFNAERFIAAVMEEK